MTRSLGLVVMAVAERVVVSRDELRATFGSDDSLVVSTVP